MRHVLSFAIAFCFLGLTIDLVYADKPVAATVDKANAKEMPVGKARTVERAALLAVNLQTAIQKAMDENPVFKEMQDSLKRARAEAAAVYKEYAIGDDDVVNYETGKITRAQKTAKK